METEIITQHAHKAVVKRNINGIACLSSGFHFHEDINHSIELSLASEEGAEEEEEDTSI